MQKQQHQQQQKYSRTASSGSTTEMEPLHTDYPAKGKVSLSYAAGGSNSPRRGIQNNPLTNFVRHLLRTLTHYISLLCTVYPTPCAIFLFVVIALGLFGIGEAIFNPRIQYGYTVHDHSNLKSIYDYQIANIDHWCLKGDSESCRCEDPLQPISRAEHNSWMVAFKNNRKIVMALENADPPADVDIAFLGESVVEEMDGRWMGMARGGRLETLKDIFDTHFNKEKGGKLTGVALGIAGDTAPNVLFRLLHGELSQRVHPKIYWLSLGMNDLSRMQCSEEIVVLGILRVVEEIINHTNSYVVINSVLPMTQMRGSAYPVLSDATEAFRQPPQQSRMRGFRGRPTTAGTYDPNLAVQRVPRVPQPAGNDPRVQQRGQSGWPQGQQPAQPQAWPQQNPQGWQSGQRSPPAPFPGWQPGHPVPGYNRHRVLQGRHKVTEKLLEEEAEKEEEMRDERYRHEHKREYRQNRAWANKQKKLATLTERHHIRKHAGVNKLPLWTSILTVNRQLAKYASNNSERVYYFDATSTFAQREDSRSYHLNLDRITPRGHPTIEGYMAWEDAVANMAMALVEKWKQEHPQSVYVPPALNDDDDDDDDNVDDNGADDDDDAGTAKYFNMDELLNNIDQMDDNFGDDLIFKNTDDEWLQRLGDDEYADGDDDSYGQGDDGNIDGDGADNGKDKNNNAGKKDNDSGGGDDDGQNDDKPEIVQQPDTDDYSGN